MVTLVAVDDTDSRAGGCTTHLAGRILDALPGSTPAGHPWLVRLNPNVPWKTRGNGAVVVPIDTPRRLGPTEVFARVRRLVLEHSRLDDAATSPGLAVSEAAVDPATYEACVRRIVQAEEAEAALRNAGAVFGGFAGGRGLVGCAGALAWDPRHRDHTFELIAYREPSRWGTPRGITADTVRDAAAIPGTFDSYDFVEDEVVMVPRSPCPVLWGLRGDDPESLAKGLDVLGPERAATATLFVSNQGTDDHLEACAASGVRERGSHAVEGRIAEAPRMRPGGHVFASLEPEDVSKTKGPSVAPGASLRIAAYEPTRSFRHVLLALAPGDRITACGGVQRGPDGALTLNVEKLETRELVPRREKQGNPRCVACARAMKSKGRHAPYRCPGCGARASREAGSTESGAGIGLGWHEVPARARRHLAKPLCRMRS